MGIALTDAKKQIATQLYASGSLTVSDIAKNIGVGQVTLSNWFNKQAWYVPRYHLRSQRIAEKKKAEIAHVLNPVEANINAGENSFIIPGALPGMNEYIKALDKNRYEGAKLKKQTEEFICRCIKAAFKNVDAFSCAVQVHIRFYEKDRRRDYDNITSGAKFILDAMRKAGVIYNDGQKFVLPSTYDYDVDAHYPRVEVKITPHPEYKLPESAIKKTAVHKANSLRYMSDGEIVRAYNAAADKNKQIKILAELNAMSVSTVEEIVGVK